MYKEQALQSNISEFSRCEDQMRMTGHRKSPGSIQQTDVAICKIIDNALWKDNVLRALDYYHIDVHVINRVVYLNGHIVSTASLRRVKNAVQAIPGILKIQNNLVLDDQLTREVAGSLGRLEHTNHCKFFTGVSHGVVLLNGQVDTTELRLSAEKCVANHPKVRGVINNIRVPGVDLGNQDHRFLQPPIGKNIYFLDGISGIVRKVVINPDNRRVTAMIIQGHFYDLQVNPISLYISGGQSIEQLRVIPVSAVKHMTKNSGFLAIHSSDFTKVQEFDQSLFTTPDKDWVPPYPYCPNDILFPTGYQRLDKITEDVPTQSSFSLKTEEQKEIAELLYNDSLGG